MTEADLLAQLDETKRKRAETERLTEEWAALCVEIGRLTGEIWRIRRGSPPLSATSEGA